MRQSEFHFKSSKMLINSWKISYFFCHRAIRNFYFLQWYFFSATQQLQQQHKNCIEFKCNKNVILLLVRIRKKNNKIKIESIVKNNKSLKKYLKKNVSKSLNIIFWPSSLCIVIDSFLRFLTILRPSSIIKYILTTQTRISILLAKVHLTIEHRFSVVSFNIFIDNKRLCEL